MDRIVIEGLPCQVRLGVPSEERSEPQPIVLDVEIRLDLERAGQTDDIRHTIDYGPLVEALRSTLSRGSFHLLEHVAERACRLVLEDDRVLSTRILARKFPQSLKGKLDSVAVVLERASPGAMNIDRGGSES